MFENYLTKFISECVKNGQNTTAEMCKKAKTEIDEINKEIDGNMQEIDKLRQKKTNLYSVIKQLGGDNDCSGKEYKNVDFSIPEDKLAKDYKILCADICKLVDKTSDGLLISEIIDKLSFLEDNEKVYFAIKRLAGQSIIDRREDLRIVKGENWKDKSYA